MPTRTHEQHEAHLRRKAEEKLAQKELRKERIADDSYDLIEGEVSRREGPKLTGYDWFRSIGSPKYAVAPMVDQSDLPYRMLTRSYGATLVWTQMFNAAIFASQKEYRIQNFTTCPEDRPLIVQLAGHDPAAMLAAARLVEGQCDAVDINLGCPQGIAKRGRYGAFLMEELDLLSEIVSLLANNLDIPVTCKTRIYKGENGFERSVKLAETLVNAGASMLTIHGRTREEKGHMVGAVDWETIRRLKEHFAGRVPIVCNGGVFDCDDVQRCLEYTKCDAVMSSEGVLENPGLFSGNIHTTHGYYANQLKLSEEYLAMCEIYPTWYFRTIRSHMQKMMYRYCVNPNEDLRDMLLNYSTIDEYRSAIQVMRERQHAQRSSLEHRLNNNNNNNNNNIDEGSHGTKNDPVDATYYLETWYHRHWSAGSHTHARKSGTGCLPGAAAEKTRMLQEKTEQLMAECALEGGEDGEGLLGNFFAFA